MTWSSFSSFFKDLFDISFHKIQTAIPVNNTFPHITAIPHAPFLGLRFRTLTPIYLTSFRVYLYLNTIAVVSRPIPTNVASIFNADNQFGIFLKSPYPFRCR